MTGSTRFLWIGICWLLLASICSAAEWKVGIAKAKITPLQRMPMAGYAGRGAKHAEGTLTDLWAKVLVLEDAQGHRAALVTMDLVGISRTVSETISDEIQQTQHWDRSQIALCTSHTHTGPIVLGVLEPTFEFFFGAEDQQLVRNYTDFLCKSVTKAVADAVAELKPAEVTWGSGRATFAVNRRENKEADVTALRAAGKLLGPSDHDVPVLTIRQAGKLTAIVFGYACHSTVLSDMKWSGDYAGFAQIELEQAYPGCQAMFWAGCGADQNPLPRRTVELARAYGADLAKAVRQVVDAPQTLVAATLKTSYQEVELPLGPLPTTSQIEADANSKDRYVASRAKMLLEQINSGQPLQPFYPYPIAVWKLGDEITFVLLGGEVVVDYAIRLKEDARVGPLPAQIWCASYTNDVMAYIPSRRVLQEGGYEGGGAMVYYGLPSAWALELEEIIVQSVREQAAR